MQSDHGAAWRVDETFGWIDGRSRYVFSLAEDRYGMQRLKSWQTPATIRQYGFDMNTLRQPSNA
jgi:hypothetical protein